MKRIFILGNGPSLAKTPLDMLIGEDTFALNRIHLIYPSVQWRPKFFYYVDYVTNSFNWREPIDANVGVAEHLWLYEIFRAGYPAGHPNYNDFPKEMGIGDVPNVTWLPMCKAHKGYSGGNPKGMKEWHFPEICTAYNGISPVIQIAVQMGYEEIYLLGCDLGYNPLDLTSNHFSKDYIKGHEPPNAWDGVYWAQADDFNARVAHQIAKKECEKRGVIIKNATLGGELEIYERVNLEAVIGRKVL
jgi:hypothetical protein